MWGGKGSALAGAGPTACHRSRDRPQPFANWATAPSSECRHHCRCHSQPLSSTSLIPLVPNRIYPCVPAGRKLPATNDDCLRQSRVRACHPLGSQRRSIDAPNTLWSLDTKTDCVRPGPYLRPLPVPGIQEGGPPGCGTYSTCSPNSESSLPTILSRHVRLKALSPLRTHEPKLRSRQASDRPASPGRPTKTEEAATGRATTRRASLCLSTVHRVGTHK